MFSRIENADQISFELKVNEKLILRRNIKDYIEISYNGTAINKNQFCDKIIKWLDEYQTDNVHSIKKSGQVKNYSEKTVFSKEALKLLNEEFQNNNNPGNKISLIAKQLKLNKTIIKTGLKINVNLSEKNKK